MTSTLCSCIRDNALAVMIHDPCCRAKHLHPDESFGEVWLSIQMALFSEQVAESTVASLVGELAFPATAMSPGPDSDTRQPTLRGWQLRRAFGRRHRPTHRRSRFPMDVRFGPDAAHGAVGE